MTELEAQDAKLVTLARASMARVGADHGAAIRDTDGRSYAAAPVAMACLRIGPLDLSVAQAVSAGAAGVEAAAFVTSLADPIISLASVRELGGEGIPVYVADPRGDVVKVLTT